jgi:peptide/nickel transport system permease protein
MGTYIGRRLGQMLPVIFLVSIVVFALAHNMPGDPVRLLMGQNADPQAMANKRQELGLNDDFVTQYLRYMSRVVLHGDFGKSYAKAGSEVTTILVDRFAVTWRLALLATLWSTVIGVAAGIVAAVKPYSLADYICMLGALLGVSLPVFYLGFLLIVLIARNVGLPVGSYDPATLGTQFRSLLLPSLALGALSSAIVARMTRATMLEILSQDYVRTARAKGLSGGAVVLKHALRNAAIPVVTVVGANLASLLVGATLTETVFSLPGLGREIVQAIFQRDRELIAGGVLFMAGIFLAVNLLVDLTYAWFDPRVRLSR